MKTWITKKLKTIREWAEYPEPDQQLFEDCGAIVREAASRCAAIGMVEHHKRYHKVSRATPANATAILRGILADQRTEYLSVPEVARLLSVNPTTVRGWIGRGRLPAIRSGRAYKIKRTDLDQLRETAIPPKQRRKTDPTITKYF